MALTPAIIAGAGPCKPTGSLQLTRRSVGRELDGVHWGQIFTGRTLPKIFDGGHQLASISGLEFLWHPPKLRSIH